MDLIALVLITVIWFISLPSFLLFLSDQISLIGAYQDHRVNLFDTFWMMIKRNACLSLPLIFSFYIIIRGTVKEIDIITTFLLALPLTLITLFFLRLLSNLPKNVKPALCHLYRKNYEGEILDLHKERLLSFYFSFISLAQIILLIIWSYNVLKGVTLATLFYPFETLGFFDSTKYFLLYLSFLGLVTLMGELILKRYPPSRIIPAQ